MSDTRVWIIILAMAVGTYLIRFSFLGLVGSRDLPERLLRLLRYTPVAVMPGIVAPMLFRDPAVSGDPARLLAALATLVVGVWTKKLLWAIGAGLVTFYGLGAALG